MTTYRVSGEAQFRDILNSVNPGDEILLSGGNYGSLALTSRWQSDTKQSGSLKIASADPGNPAIFSKVSAISVSNVTFEGIRFQDSGSSKAFLFNKVSNVTIDDSDFVGGNGSSHGIWVTDSANLTISNSEISNYNTGGWFLGVQNLQIIGNDITGIDLDGLMLGNLENALISGNSIEMSTQDVRHKDIIQVWATTTVGTSENIVIRNNALSANDSTAHGIYMGNDAARSTGNPQYYFQDVLIENNTVRSGQALGIAVGETNGLVVRGNVVLQHAGQDSDRPVNVPVILFENDARNVTISGNTTHKQPAPAGVNFQPTNDSNSSWTISNNKIVPLGTSGSAPPTQGGGGAGPQPPAPPPPAAPPRDDDGAGSGSADGFRFNGGSLSSDRRITFDADFTEGDRIVLSNFDRGTFDGINGGNRLEVNNAGTYVRLDSTADLQELASASPDVSLLAPGNILTLRIDQGRDTLDIALPNYDSGLL